MTLVAGIVFYGIVFFRTREDASILTSSIVLSYCLYLSWSALASDPNAECNPFTKSASNTALQLIVGLFITMVALITISSSTVKSDESNLTTRMNGAVMENEENAQESEKLNPDNERTNGKEAHVFPVTTATIVFQALMILAAVYYAMLLTNWGNPTLFTDTTNFFQANNTSFWVKLVAQWVTIIIYLFSLIAPLLFPDREF